MLLSLFILSHEAHAAGRKGIFSPPKVELMEDGTSQKDDASFFTVGTLLGMSAALYDVTTYKVREVSVVDDTGATTTGGYVVTDKSANVGRALSPGVWVMPSIALADLGKKLGALSVIVPGGAASLPGGTAYGVGIGASVGLETYPNRASTGEVGLSIACVWSSAQGLTDAQAESYKNATALPSGEGYDIGTELKPRLALGIYVAPSLGGSK